MLDPVFFFFYHLIHTESLPGKSPGRSRKMASETFFAKFTEYCEKEGYPTPKDMETVAKIIESVPEVWVDRVEHDHRDYHVRIFTGEIYFPDPDMLKKWLDAYSTATREASPSPDPPTATREDISENEKENRRQRRQARRRENYKSNPERERASTKRYYWNKKGPPKTPVAISENEKENRRQRRLARRRENYKKRSEPERERERASRRRRRNLRKSNFFLG